MTRRRELIRELIRTRAIATQQELVALLAARGQRITQSQISRELGRRGVGKKDGVYVLPEAPPPSTVASLVADVVDNGTLVIVRTASGAAPAVASAIDRVRPRALLGTLAGDDTIFLAPARGASAARLAREIRTLLR